MTKTEMIQAIQRIKSKNLKPPIKLNQASTIIDINKYLHVLEQQILHTNKQNLLKLFEYKIQELLNL